MSKTMDKVLSLLARDSKPIPPRAGLRGEYKVIEFESAIRLQDVLNEELSTNGFTYCGHDGRYVVLFRK